LRLPPRGAQPGVVVVDNDTGAPLRVRFCSVDRCATHRDTAARRGWDVPASARQTLRITVELANGSTRCLTRRIPDGAAPITVVVSTLDPASSGGSDAIPSTRPAPR
jgi:hypothetical protein